LKWLSLSRWMFICRNLWLPLDKKIRKGIELQRALPPDPPNRGSAPWTPLGALPPGPCYRLVLRARHCIQTLPRPRVYLGRLCREKMLKFSTALPTSSLCRTPRQHIITIRLIIQLKTTLHFSMRELKLCRLLKSVLFSTLTLLVGQQVWRVTACSNCPTGSPMFWGTLSKLKPLQKRPVKQSLCMCVRVIKKLKDKTACSFQ